MLFRTCCLSAVCVLFVTGPSFAADVVVFRDIRYREGASKQWKLDLAMRKEVPSKPRPAIVVIHGGGWLNGDKSSFSSDKRRIPANIIDFASLGFVAVTINYRLSGEAPFPAAVEDCKCAVRWLRAHAREYHVDPKHIGAWGNSAGGHLALMLAMAGKEAHLEGDGPYQKESSVVQAAVSDSGPIDMTYQYGHSVIKQAVAQFLKGPPEGKRSAEYQKASPAHYVRQGTPPLLLLYGVADDQVPIETADAFVAALDRAGAKDVSYYRLANVYHCPHSLVGVPVLRTVVNEFFIRTLLHPETAHQVIRRVGKP